MNLQVIIDIFFFITIVILLGQIHKRIVKQSPVIDESLISEFKKVLEDSQNYTNQFLKTVGENEQRLKMLSRQLDTKEKRLLILIEELEGLINKADRNNNASGTSSIDAERSKQIGQMIREGRSREEMMKQFGMSEGELNLIVALEQIKANHT